MDFFQTSQSKPKQKQSPNKHTPLGKRLTQDQVRLLEKSFVVNKKLDPERKLQLAGELGVPPRQVAIWYQNRRARWKTQTLELDHVTLQLKLDSALAEKERLQKDVEVLRGELRRVQDLIFSFNNVGKGHPLSSSPPFSLVSNFNCTASGDEGGSGSCGISEDAVNCCWEDDDDAAMRADDLYACLMLTNGSNMNKERRTIGWM